VENPPKLVPPAKTEGRLERIEYPVNPRLARMRAFSRLLDTAIPLPGGFRIGIDPIIGLVPGIGDVIASTLSVWLVYDAARLGIAKRVLARMVGNVMIEAAIGAIPVIGDFIDAAWKANARNMRLVEAAYSPALKERSKRKLIGFTLGTLLLVYGSLFLAMYALVSWLLAMFGAVFGPLFDRLSG
jgi:hypothetical protein